MIVGTTTLGTSNDGPIVCDTPMDVSSASKMYEASGTIPSLFKSPDASGRYPLINMLVGDTSTGVRHRLPSTYITSINNLVDRDIIQVDGMNFEVPIAAGTIAGIGQMLAYRI